MEQFGIAVWDKKSMIMSMMAFKICKSRLIMMICRKKTQSKKGTFLQIIILKKIIEVSCNHCPKWIYKKTKKLLEKKGWLLIKYFFARMIYHWQREELIIFITLATEPRALSAVLKRMITLQIITKANILCIKDFPTLFNKLSQNPNNSKQVFKIRRINK